MALKYYNKKTLFYLSSSKSLQQ